MEIFNNIPWLNNELAQTTLFIIVALWAFIWKGLALWQSSRENQKFWFIALLTINTVGILEIAYLFYFAKKRLTFKKLLLILKTSFQSLRKKLPLPQ